MRLEDLLDKIESSRDDIISTMCDMIRIPAIAPENGGMGEGLRADMLISCLQGYDSIQRIDVPDSHDSSILRPNILAKKNGPEKGTVWIVAHIDTVPEGDLDDWDSPPFEPRVECGRIYGRGTEDNGQAVISSMFASKFIPAGSLTKKSIGIAYVADEETTSKFGIEYLLNEGYFDEDDIIIVPDWGVPGGSLMDVSEKSLLWVEIETYGKTTHGSTPDKGLNAFKISSEILVDLVKKLEEKYSAEDSLFFPPYSTFEPTKSPATVTNVNTIPGYASFSLDMRIIEKYDTDEILTFIKSVVKEHEIRTGAKINVSEIQRHTSGPASSTSTPEFRAIKESIESVIHGELNVAGVGGATCANFFRLAGMDAYVWECGGGTLHAPNEYVEIENILVDAKAFATIFFKLCV